MWPCANFFIILFSFFLFFIFFPHERCSSMTGRALDALFLDVTDKFIVWTAFHDSSILHANSTAIHGNNCATIERRAKLKIGGRFIVASHRLEIKSSGDFAGQTVGNSRFSGFQWAFFSRVKCYNLLLTMLSWKFISLRKKWKEERGPVDIVC